MGINGSSGPDLVHDEPFVPRDGSCSNDLHRDDAPDLMFCFLRNIDHDDHVRHGYSHNRHLPVWLHSSMNYGPVRHWSMRQLIRLFTH